MRYPYAEIEFEKDGSIHDLAQVRAAVDMVRDSGATDVLVLSHGWNNNMPAARALYSTLIDNMDDVRPQVPAAAGRTFAVIGILWPAIQWADEIAGGGAGVADPAAALAAQITDRVDDDAAAELAALVEDLDTSAAARARYLEILRGLLPTEGADGEDAPPEAFTQGDVETVFELARSSGGLTGAPAAVGGAAGFSLGGFLAAARNLLNVTTYYTMKARAGTVGTRGVAQVLDAVAEDVPAVRIHLVGHSFGARALTSAALVTRAPIHSLSLLQGAYSHYGMAQNWDGRGTDGIFRAVPARLGGPLIVTHTKNDKAVGLAYAIASRLARQAGAGLGDSSDVYGGIGRNGALKTPEALPADTLRDVGTAYVFAPRRVSNLKADDFISGHGDVAGRQVAYAVLTAATTPPAP